MARRLVRTVAAVALLLAVLVGVPWTPPSAGAAAVNDGPGGCDDLSGVLGRNDDSSTGLVPIGFNINFSGTSYSSLYVNNNGNVTFTSSLSTYTPFGLLTSSIPIIAPFFADVDTRNAASDVVTYGTIANWEGTGRSAFCVNWDGVMGGVGYYSNQANPLNQFQLVLVERSDRGAGDFDIVFNYDQVLWQIGSASDQTAGAGFTNGSNFDFEFPGSRVPGSFLDSNPSGLVHQSNVTQSNGAPFNGRYVFPVQNGLPPGTSSIAGRVFNQATNAGLAGARVDACIVSNAGVPTSCPGGAFTGSDGSYSMLGLPPGNYRVSVNPPSAAYQPGGTATFALASGAQLTGIDVGLAGPLPPVPGTGIGGSGFIGNNSAGTPVVVVGAPVTITEMGCPGGTGHWELRNPTTGAIVVQGGMTETSAVSPLNSSYRVFTATVQFPVTGTHVLFMQVNGCPPGGPVATSASFTIYIDPSGHVVDQNDQPIVGATVTLYRSDTGDPGTFGVVADGSALMSPSNRTNPDTTDGTGHFGWDVVAGYYFVRATNTGCTAPGNPSQAYVDSQIYEIPPPVTDVLLKLQCGSTPPPADAKCQGKVVTISGSGSIEGTPGPDVILGSAGPDVINGLGGADTICAGGGADTVNGGEGNDAIVGDNDDDVLNGGGGDDTIYGLQGRDTIRGGEGADKLYGGLNDDNIGGEGGNDIVDGQDGNDVVDGGTGNDIVSGGAGNDTLSGAAGGDLLAGGAGTDSCAGGAGVDNFQQCETTSG
jgi:Ca2+-binding RTX toxin-like protein